MGDILIAIRLISARDYLPRMYSASAYAAINEIQQLPLKVSDIIDASLVDLKFTI